ncbi:efflux RND transporter periplasmic adaptor subunit [Halodesulfovibrio spirochaetisodalis]|uniref:efflux RND transporter periplasmic adaptor subunit n=1 Tax=Halodesulfovibrio spirochaetisodalis TaxID=1560234 RepID=UPI00082D2AD5|nr:efflux RND transporter periplasmic adaptor subunit [Halodesulfovibrio spirochaetisodalis]
MKIKYLTLLLGLTMLALTTAACFWIISTPVKPALTEEKTVPHPVSIIRVNSAPHTASVVAYGQVVPYRKTDIVSAVSGRVVQRSAAFDKGMRVTKGELLATVEDVAYRSAVSLQQKELADAKLALLQEERRALQAKKDWKRMGNGAEPTSALVLHQPQLEAAQARLAAAKASLATAQNNLENTRITAPYDAAIISRKVAIGSFVSAGTVVGSLYGIDCLEVQLPLTEAQYNLLPISMDSRDTSWRKTPVLLSSVTDPTLKWEGFLITVDLQITKNTRQRIAIVRIKNPLDAKHPLLPGTFVKAELSGITLNDLFAVPESSLTQNGNLWFVDIANTLQKMKADIKFRKQGTIYTQLPTATQTNVAMNIVLKPLGSYLPGTVVSPQPVEAMDEQ